MHQYYLIIDEIQQISVLSSVTAPSGGELTVCLNILRHISCSIARKFFTSLQQKLATILDLLEVQVDSAKSQNWTQLKVREGFN